MLQFLQKPKKVGKGTYIQLDRQVHFRT